MARYFAYGSNMLGARLKARCASARVLSAAHAEGFDLAFDKRGQDGSGKATLLEAPGRRVPGVLFHLDDADLEVLDWIEGRGYGYERRTIPLQTAGQDREALTYIAPPDYRDARLRPFDWYLSLVLAGAHEQRLPAGWIARLAAEPAIPDPETARPRRLEALELLDRCPPEWRLP